MVDYIPHLYFKKGVSDGHDPELVRKASAQYYHLKACGLQPILSLKHLADLSDVKWGYLRKIVERSIDQYDDILKQKRQGGTRPIFSPHPNLMRVQRWLLRNVLNNLTYHQSSHAYQNGKSILTCATQHIGARWLIKFDLHSFFDTITEDRVYKVFRDLGYGNLISFEMARICTHLCVPQLKHGKKKKDVYPVIPEYQNNSLGSLPQGAPTSGALANYIAKPLDIELTKIAIDNGLVYTRYSDDLTFSAIEFDRDRAKELIAKVRWVAERNGFVLHRKKTRVIPPGARAIVLGLLVDSERVRLLPEFRRKIEINIRGVEKFGLSVHIRHRGFNSVFSFIDHVDGMLAFAYSVDKDFAHKMFRRWNNALARSKYPVALDQRDRK